MPKYQRTDRGRAEAHIRNSGREVFCESGTKAIKQRGAEEKTEELKRRRKSIAKELTL